MLTYSYNRTASLRLGPGQPEERVTDSLKKMSLKAKNKGDLESAVISAAFYAQKQGKTMYVYSGNSFGHAVWRVTFQASDYLNSVNNTGSVVYSVTPELDAVRHTVLGRD